jgi:NADPH-dependent glutamate synthase beta subunit-like oxidoreductase
MEKEQRIAWEAKCTQDEPPACSSGCPLHIDVRQFMQKLTDGDNKAAYQTLKKTMPFPGILGRICDRPCEAACRRQEAGEALAIGALERFCVEQYSGPDPVKPLPRKRWKVAVLGTGMAGLTAALDMLNKGLQVTIYEQAQQLGSALRSYPKNVLPAAVIDAELAVLTALRATLHLGTQCDAATFTGLVETFDAIFVDGQATATWSLPLQKEANGRIVIDALTAATAEQGVFAGGEPDPSQSYSPIMEAYAGRKGALSIERFLQKATIDYNRQNEGPHTTRLHTNIEGIEASSRALPEQLTDEAVQAEASRCMQCECLECVKHCDYLKKYKKHPKPYIRQIFNNEKVLHGAGHTANKFVNSCSLCGLCEQVCPNGLSMGEVCLESRQTMVREKFMPASAHEFALQDLEFSRSEAFSLVRHAPGFEESAYLYFPSCQLCSSSPGEVMESYRFLRENLDGGVGLMLACCGAPAFWGGRKELFAEIIAELRQQWREMGGPQIISACSSCQQLFQDHLPEIPVKSLWQMLEKPELKQALPASPLAAKTVAILDPCATRLNPKVQQGVRQTVTERGLTIEELDYSGETTQCCGYGGLVFNANPELTDEQLRCRVEASDHDYLAYCALCRDQMAAAGKPTAHLIELLFGENDNGDPWQRGWLSWSERRENRARVKEVLGRHLWGEEPSLPESYQEMILHLDNEVQRTVDRRRILLDDIRQVIDQSETEGRRLINKDNGRHLANRALGKVTFWVEYAPEGKGFRVFNAYSHRMNITGVK